MAYASSNVMVNKASTMDFLNTWTYVKKALRSMCRSCPRPCFNYALLKISQDIPMTEYDAYFDKIKRIVPTLHVYIESTRQNLPIQFSNTLVETIDERLRPYSYTL